jgi:hypothetical protein
VNGPVSLDRAAHTVRRFDSSARYLHGSLRASTRDLVVLAQALSLVSFQLQLFKPHGLVLAMSSHTTCDALMVRPLRSAGMQVSNFHEARAHTHAYRMVIAAATAVQYSQSRHPLHQKQATH